jgi:hypothetical protein
MRKERFGSNELVKANQMYFKKAVQYYLKDVLFLIFMFLTFVALCMSSLVGHGKWFDYFVMFLF